MRWFLLFTCALLAGCAGMTAAQTTGAVVSSMPPILLMLQQWRDADILSPEQFAEASAIFQNLGGSLMSIMELVRIWGNKTEVVAQSQVTAEQAAAISAGAATAGGIVLNAWRNSTRKKAMESQAKP